MRIYFSCSLTGGRQDQPAYAAMVTHLQATGHTVLTAHLADPEVMAKDGDLDPVTVYERDAAWLRECDAVIAEVSTLSHGVGFELAYAQDRAKPVLCCHRAGVRVSKMITGNAGLEVVSYRETVTALDLMDAFLSGIKPK